MNAQQIGDITMETVCFAQFILGLHFLFFCLYVYTSFHFSPHDNMHQYHAPIARLPEGWRKNVRIQVDDSGIIRDIASDVSIPQNATRLTGAIMPAFANLHSHAFQRAMAGLAEHRSNSQDSFWSWRDEMYRVALKITPEQLYHIARYLYIELLEGGFTSVAEFHYLHHQSNGIPYSNSAELYAALSQAAADVGMGLTLLPTLYSYSDFGAQPATNQQRRFIQQTEAYLKQLEQGAAFINQHSEQRLGGCFHSLRACQLDQLSEVIAAVPTDWPLHMHISEQPKEVAKCIEVHGTSPFNWLNEHINVDPRWTLIHATHLTKQELNQLAQSGAVAGICPTTEASLGDGIFPTTEYLNQGGILGIGTDSHVGTQAAEELRWLEYAQRLVTGARNCLATPEQPSNGERLLDCCYQGGQQALGQKVGQLKVGYRADWLELDEHNPWLAEAPLNHLTDSWLFATQSPTIKNVVMGGALQLSDFHHPLKEQASIDLEKSLRQLRN